MKGCISKGIYSWDNYGVCNSHRYFFRKDVSFALTHLGVNPPPPPLTPPPVTFRYPLLVQQNLAIVDLEIVSLEIIE